VIVYASIPPQCWGAFGGIAERGGNPSTGLLTGGRYRVTVNAVQTSPTLKHDTRYMAR
jgi:hypothetical protein